MENGNLVCGFTLYVLPKIAKIFEKVPKVTSMGLVPFSLHFKVVGLPCRP